ncbi:hypothetical protein LCGC14_0153750 [marine sediment metagenome]|uniref:Uncharacterized protein n=1 Tax=marine sediment metagenome TaxID=412755 RepID=A0A0F9V1L0_9ZZZZ
MSECCEFTRTALCSTIMAGKSIGAVTAATWVCLGGCRSHMNALRVYQAVKAGGGR